MDVDRVIVEMNDDEENELLKSDDEESLDSAPVQEIEDSSESDEEQDEKQIKAYANLLQFTKDNRYSYDSYLQLTDIAQ